MVRLPHSADWQLGAHFSQFGSSGGRLREARLETLKRSLELAEKHEVEAFLIAGDLFEDNQVDDALVVAVLDLFRAHATLPIYLLPGNHDPHTGPDSVWQREAFLNAPAHVHVIREAIRATGRVKTLEPTQVKDRLIDLEQMIDTFLADFRAIEDRFKEQAAEIHENYLERGRSKGDIVEQALDADEALRNSEQGKSYYGFRALIRSLESREALSHAIADVSRLAAQSGMDDRVFLSLMERLLLQVTVVQESYQKIAAQLRHVVEEAATQDSRQLMEWIAEIKQRALGMRDNPPAGDAEGVFIQVDEGIGWANLLEVGFYEKKEPGKFSPVSTEGEDDADDVKAAVKKIGKPLDLEGCRRKVASLLERHDQVALKQVVSEYPLAEGAVDLIGYLCVAAEKERHLIDEAEREQIDLNRPGQPRFATLNRIIFQRQ